MAYMITEPCIGTKDSACVDVCPVDCIHPRKDEPEFATVEQLYIHPDECIDCGACVPACPVEAIFALDEVPDKWKDYIDDELGVLPEVGRLAAAAGPARGRPPRSVMRSRRTNASMPSRAKACADRRRDGAGRPAERREPARVHPRRHGDAPHRHRRRDRVPLATRARAS